MRNTTSPGEDSLDWYEEAIAYYEHEAWKVGKIIERNRRLLHRQRSSYRVRVAINQLLGTLLLTKEECEWKTKHYRNIGETLRTKLKRGEKGVNPSTPQA